MLVLLALSILYGKFVLTATHFYFFVSLIQFTSVNVELLLELLLPRLITRVLVEYLMMVEVV
jgi:hypothetical protein